MYLRALQNTMPCGSSCEPPYFYCVRDKCCSSRYVGDSCQFDVLYYDTAFLGIYFLFSIVALVSYYHTSRRYPDGFSTTKATILAVIIFFFAKMVGKLLGVLTWTLSFQNEYYFLFRQFLVGDFSWTCIIAVLSLNILDWMQIMSKITVHDITQYDNSCKYMPVFCVVVFLSLLLGSLDLVGEYTDWKFTQILVFSYGLIASAILSLIFFMSSRAIINELANINIKATNEMISRLQKFRWGVMIFILSFVVITGVQLLLKYYFDTSNPELFVDSVSEILMSAIPTMICYFVLKRIDM